MRSMQWQLGILGTISAFDFRHRETKKHKETNNSIKISCAIKGVIFRAQETFCWEVHNVVDSKEN